MARVRGASFTLIGSKELKANLRRANGRLRQAIGAGLYLEGNRIIGESKRQVPVDLGALKGSGYVTLPVIQRNKVTVEIGYGGPAKDYAIVQELRTDFRHPEGGKSHYLTDPVNAASGSFLRNVGAFARRAFDLNQSASKAPGMPTNPDEGGRET